MNIRQKIRSYIPDLDIVGPVSEKRIADKPPQGGQGAMQPEFDEFEGHAGRELIIDNAPRVMTAQKVGVKRDLQRIMENIRTSALVAGDRFYYRWPIIDKDGKRTYVEGPTIKCALSAARLYGNNTVGTRVVDEGTHYLFEAFFVDLETGFNLMRPFRQRKSQRTMRTDADRQADIVLQIGASKSIRNVIVNALEGICDFAVEEAKNSLVERIGKNLALSRQRLLDRLGDIGVVPERVAKYVGRSVDQMLAPDIARVIAEISAIEDGMSTAADLWPEAKPEENQQTDVKAGLDQFDAVTKSDRKGRKAEAQTSVLPDAQDATDGERRSES